MSNSKELDLLIQTAFGGKGADAAVAKLREIATTADATQAKLVAAFNAGEIEADRFNAEMSKTQATVNNYVRAAQTATQATANHAAGHGTLASAIGASRGQLGSFINTAAQAAGVEGDVAKGLSIITSGLGPVGVGLGMATLAWNKAAEIGQVVIDRNQALAKSMAEDGRSVAEITAALKAANFESDSHTNRLVVMAQAYERLAAAAHYAAITPTEGGGNAARMEDYNAGVAKAAKETYDAGLAMYNAAAASKAMGDNVAASAGDLDNMAAAAQAAGDAIGGVRWDAAGNAAGDAAREALVRGANDDRKEIVGAARAGASESAQAWTDAWLKERDDSKRTADQLVRDQQRAAKAEAEKKSQLTETVREASQLLTDAQNANVQAILNTAASADEKLRMLSAYLNSLPNSKDIRILLDFNGNLDLARMLGLIGGGGQPSGSQQGPQALFEFVGESIETQTRFINAANGDRDKAARNWTAQHLKEVQQDIKDGFDATGRRLSAIEIATEKAYLKAANDPTNSSHDPFAANSDDPHYKPPKYGTDPNTYGGSDDKRPPGYSGAKGLSAGTNAPAVMGAGSSGPSIVIHANIYNNMDVEELAWRVFQYANKMGAH